MKDPEGKKKSGISLRTWGFIAGGALLLAILTLVLCIMGGVFDFGSGGAAQTASPSPTASVQTDAPAETTPPATATPSPSPTPTADPVKKYSISAISGKGGSISPSGLVSVEEGGSVSFSITPDSGYYISELKIDGVSVDASSSYTFSGVTGDHSIYAVFRETPAATPTPTAQVSPTPEIIG